jgi:hypothetical protein
MRGGVNCRNSSNFANFFATTSRTNVAPCGKTPDRVNKPRCEEAQPKCSFYPNGTSRVGLWASLVPTVGTADTWSSENGGLQALEISDVLLTIKKLAAVFALLGIYENFFGAEWTFPNGGAFHGIGKENTRRDKSSLSLFCFCKHQATIHFTQCWFICRKSIKTILIRNSFCEITLCSLRCR